MFENSIHLKLSAKRMYVTVIINHTSRLRRFMARTFSLRISIPGVVRSAPKSLSFEKHD